MRQVTKPGATVSHDKSFQGVGVRAVCIRTFRRLKVTKQYDKWCRNIVKPITVRCAKSILFAILVRNVTANLSPFGLGNTKSSSYFLRYLLDMDK